MCILCMYVYTHVSIHIHTHYTCVCMCILLMYIDVCVYVYKHINIHVYTYIHICRYIRVCIHTHLLNTCIYDCMKIYVHLCDMSRAPIYARDTTHILYFIYDYEIPESRTEGRINMYASYQTRINESHTHDYVATYLCV